MSKKATKKQDNYALAYEPKKRLTENQKLKLQINELLDSKNYWHDKYWDEHSYNIELNKKFENLKNHQLETLRVAEIRLKQSQDLTEILLNHSRNDHFNQMLEAGKVLSTQLLTK